MRLRLAAYIASDDWRKKYDKVWAFNYGFAIVDLDGKSGMVNTEGVEVVEPKYDGMEYFQAGLAAVRTGVEAAPLGLDVEVQAVG